MKPLIIAINGEYGLLFEGVFPHAYTFVPQNCVKLRDDGSFLIDRMAYVKGSWAIRNMRFNALDLAGTRLFPDERKPVVKTDAPGLDEFLGHLRNGYGAQFDANPAVIQG